MFEIGKLYKITATASGIYSSPTAYTSTTNGLKKNDMFVLLEQKNVSTHMHYKILTTTGVIGWITIGDRYIEPVQEE